MSCLFFHALPIIRLLVSVLETVHFVNVAIKTEHGTLGFDWFVARYGRNISWNVVSLDLVPHEVTSFFYYEQWTDKWKYFYVSEIHITRVFLKKQRIISTQPQCYLTFYWIWIKSRILLYYHLTKWHHYVFSVSLKFGAYYITGQWGEFMKKMLLNVFIYFSWPFFCCFSS